MRSLARCAAVSVLAAISLLALYVAPALALTRGEDDVLVRVIDVGAGLCCVAQLSGGHYVIYDAGRWSGDSQDHAVDTIGEMIPADSTVDLLALSHSDADHLGAVPKICAAYHVAKVLRTGFERDTGTWEDADAAIDSETQNDGCQHISLGEYDLPRGATWRFGDAFLQFIAGWHEPPEDFGIDESAHESEYRNAVSICIKLVYRGRSVLFCGDTVGRFTDDPATVCIAAEKNMCEWADVIPLRADVIVAPHHGADNASSTRFIGLVQLRFVIFSAGHDYGHPRKAAAERYLAAGVGIENIFRTDLGDDEDDDGEWKHGSLGGRHHDPVADDDVDVLLTADGAIQVAYVEP